MAGSGGDLCTGAGRLGRIAAIAACRAAIGPWGGKEKAGRDALSAMPPCDSQIAS